MADQDHIAAARAHNDKWLTAFPKAMAEIGIECLPSVGNFLLLRFPAEAGRDSKAADAFLGERGLIVRSVDNYGLPDCLRVSLGLDHEMDAVVQALRDFTERS